MHEQCIVLQCVPAKYIGLFRFSLSAFNPCFRAFYNLLIENVFIYLFHCFLFITGCIIMQSMNFITHDATYIFTLILSKFGIQNIVTELSHG